MPPELLLELWLHRGCPRSSPPGLLDSRRPGRTPPHSTEAKRSRPHLPWKESLQPDPPSPPGREGDRELGPLPECHALWSNWKQMVGYHTVTTHHVIVGFKKLCESGVAQILEGYGNTQFQKLRRGPGDLAALLQGPGRGHLASSPLRSRGQEAVPSRHREKRRATLGKPGRLECGGGELTAPALAPGQAAAMLLPPSGPPGVWGNTSEGSPPHPF